MKIVTLKITNKIGVAQPLVFQFAPRFCLGVFPGPTLKFIVDTATPGKTCQAWVVNATSAAIQGSPLPGTFDGGNSFVTSDCFN